MDNVALVLSEVDQVDTVLFGVQGSLVHPTLTVVDDDLSKKDKNLICVTLIDFLPLIKRVSQFLIKGEVFLESFLIQF